MKLYHELAEYYYSIESHHRTIDDDIRLIHRLLGGKSDASILDLGCGTGEHIAMLTRLGYRCVGIDTSGAMLKIANERFPRSGSFLMQDMRSIDYFEEFDMVLSLFGTLNYLTSDEDIDSVLWNTWKALRPAGLGVLEVWNSIPVKRIREKKIGHISTTVCEAVTIERERGFTLIDPEKAIVEVDYRYVITNDSRTSVITDRHVMRAFERNEIEARLADSGFAVTGCYSDSALAAYDEFSNGILLTFIKE